jgi:predicted  nucleic acid-binding Zn-ribbon protein
MLYLPGMTAKSLKQLLERISEWPNEAQEELRRSVTEIETRYSKVYHVNEDEREALNRSAEDVRKGRFASDEEVESVFDRFHRA